MPHSVGREYCFCEGLVRGLSPPHEKRVYVECERCFGKRSFKICTRDVSHRTRDDNLFAMDCYRVTAVEHEHAAFCEENCVVTCTVRTLVARHAHETSLLLLDGRRGFGFVFECDSKTRSEFVRSRKRSKTAVRRIAILVIGVGFLPVADKALVDDASVFDTCAHCCTPLFLSTIAKGVSFSKAFLWRSIKFSEWKN